MKETQYSGYYVSEDGKVWTEFNKYTGKKDILREVNQHPRGGTNINDRYMSVNISIKDENGKFIKQILYMKKNSGKNFEALQVDPITGEYYIVIPEWIVNDLSWYEDSEINFSLEGTDLVLSEKEED
jgi:hypothetical protein